MRPLTPQEAKKKEQVVEAYSDFWNNIRFRKGWATPVFKREEVLHLLQRAAEIVVRKRSEIDARTDGLTFRMLDGSARDYLWSVEEHPVDPSDKLATKEDEFVRNLVHHTFKDGNGYVEDLTEAEIDKHILAVTKALDEDLPVIARTNQTLCRLTRLIRGVDELPSALQERVLEDPALAKQFSALARHLFQAEELGIAFVTEMEASLSQFKEEAAEETSTSDESSDGVGEVALTSAALRQSGASLPMDWEDEEPPSTGGDDMVEEEVEAPVGEEGPSTPEEKEEESSSAAEAAEAARREQEQAEAEHLRREKEKQEEKEQMRLEAAMRQRLRDRAEQKAAAEKAGTKTASPARSPSPAGSPAPSQGADAEARRVARWKQLEFEPRFDVQERSDGFLITARLPHLKRDDLSLKVDERNNRLTISGVCVPTVAEERAMLADVRRQLARRYGPQYEQFIDAKKLDTLLLRAGSDRFGTFSEQYTLPSTTMFDQISCSFENQAFRCAVPVRRAPQRNRYAQQRRDPFASPFGGYDGRRNPGGFW